MFYFIYKLVHGIIQDSIYLQGEQSFQAVRSKTFTVASLMFFFFYHTLPIRWLETTLMNNFLTNGQEEGTERMASLFIQHELSRLLFVGISESRSLQRRTDIKRTDGGERGDRSQCRNIPRTVLLKTTGIRTWKKRLERRIQAEAGSFEQLIKQVRVPFLV